MSTDDTKIPRKEDRRHEADAASSAEDGTPKASGDFWVDDDRHAEAATVEMQPGEMAQKVAADRGRTSVEVSGVVGDATRRLASEILEDAEATLDVPRPKPKRPQHHCRMCDRVVGVPVPRRHRGPIDSHQGFRCERCRNVFCAGHIVRVTPIVQSLWRPAKFRCQLCVPDGGA